MTFSPLRLPPPAPMKPNNENTSNNHHSTPTHVTVNVTTVRVGGPPSHISSPRNAPPRVEPSKRWSFDSLMRDCQSPVCIDNVPEQEQSQGNKATNPIALHVLDHGRKPRRKSQSLPSKAQCLSATIHPKDGRARNHPLTEKKTAPTTRN